MIIIIAGRTGSGKDYLSQKLKSYGLTCLKTTTTRPKRTESEDTYHFITKEDAAKIPDDQKFLRTTIGENEYFTTKEDIQAADVCILEPDGIYQLSKEMPTLCGNIVYLTADPDDRLNFAIKRGDDQTLEAERFKAREAAEDERFAAFEQAIEERTLHFDNFLVGVFENNFQEASMNRLAHSLLATVIIESQLYNMLRLMIKHNNVNMDEHGNIIAIKDDETEQGLTPEQIVHQLYASIRSADDNMAISFFCDFLTRSYCQIPRFNEPSVNKWLSETLKDEAIEMLFASEEFQKDLKAAVTETAIKHLTKLTEKEE